MDEETTNARVHKGGEHVLARDLNSLRSRLAALPVPVRNLVSATSGAGH